MKKIRIRALCLALLFALVCPLFASCSGVEEKAAVSYEGEEVSCAVFQYLCCLKKTDYLYEAYGVSSSTVSSSQLQDNAAIWSAQAEDSTTVAETLKSDVLSQVELLLYFQDVAKSRGYALGTEEKKLVQKEFDKFVAKFDSKKAFEQEMKKYGVDYDQMLAYQCLQTLAYQGEELLFGENGSMKISSDAAKAYFRENYVTASYVFINTKNKTYANGKTVVLPEEEKEAKKGLADEVYQKALAGEDFAALVRSFSDKTVSDKEAQNGVTFRKGSFSAEAEKTLLTLKAGEIARADTEEGVYIFCRKNLDLSAFDGEKDGILEQMEQTKKDDLLAAAKDKFRVDEAFVASLDVSSLTFVV